MYDISIRHCLTGPIAMATLKYNGRVYDNIEIRRHPIYRFSVHLPKGLYIEDVVVYKTIVAEIRTAFNATPKPEWPVLSEPEPIPARKQREHQSRAELPKRSAPRETNKILPHRSFCA